MPAAKRAKYFRYGGYVVRVYDGNIEVPRPLGRPVEAASGRQPRAAATLAKLPKRYRQQIRQAGDEAALQERARKSGLKLPRRRKPMAPARDAWTEPGAVATGVA